MSGFNRYVHFGWLLAACALALAASAQEPADPVPAAAREGLIFNFRGATVDTVLNYLSEKAGFVIIREAEVSGRIDIQSLQPLNEDEAVSLLNTVLNNQGLAAVRSGRTLTIVKRADAKLRELPVIWGGDPAQIPETDEIVTQIIPVLHTDASQLAENLEPLMPEDVVVSVNQASSALLITATQRTIHRVATIVEMLDTSISSITTLKVFMLVHADAEEVSRSLNRVFESSGGGGSPISGSQLEKVVSQLRSSRESSSAITSRLKQALGGGKSVARRAASNVLTVADERTNAVIVRAPEEMMPMIEGLILELDVPDAEVEIRVVVLQYAEPDEITNIINELFSGGASPASSKYRPGEKPMPYTRGGAPGSSSGGVLAIADTWNNSVILKASKEMIDEVEAFAAQLDNPEEANEVRVFPLQFVAADEIAQIVNMIFSQNAGMSRSSGSSKDYYRSRGNVPTGPAVYAVADSWSNSVIVTADKKTMTDVEVLLGQLDSKDELPEIQVVPLKFMDPYEMARIISDVFGGNSQQAGYSRDPRSREGQGRTTKTRASAGSVLAVPDGWTNSVIVTADAELMPEIFALVERIDVAYEDLPETRVFQLKYADVDEMVRVITTVYREISRPPRYIPGQGPMGAAMSLSPVQAVADERTNSVIVSADTAIMPDIEKMIKELDTNPARDQQIYIYSLENADVRSVASILEGMIRDQARRSGGGGSSSARYNPVDRTDSSSSRYSTGRSSSSSSSSSRYSPSRSNSSSTRR